MQQLRLGRALHDLAAVHHGDCVAGLGDDAEVVGHEDDGEPARVPQLQQQPQDLRLHRHIQCRRRLVGDQNAGPASERRGDHRPLAHSAGKLVRVVVDSGAGVGNAHLA